MTEITIEFLDCIPWTGAVDRNGYGVRAIRKHKRVFAHRLVYEQSFGPIPEGKHIHHICGNKLCVNPVHLLAITQREHNHIHESHEHGASVHRAKTHCKQGHSFDAENTYIAPNGQRVCRECQRRWTREWRASRK